MSLIVTIYPQEGIVMAGNSRLTITWDFQNGETFNSECIPSSDSSNKIFAIHNKFGLGFCGSATLGGILLPSRQKSIFLGHYLHYKMPSILPNMPFAPLLIP